MVQLSIRLLTGRFQVRDRGRRVCELENRSYLDLPAAPLRFDRAIRFSRGSTIRLLKPDGLPEPAGRAGKVLIGWDPRATRGSHPGDPARGHPPTSASVSLSPLAVGAVGVGAIEHSQGHGAT